MALSSRSAGKAFAPMVLAAATSLACGGAPAAEEDLGQSRSAIIAGTPSDASQDSTVMLAFSDPASRTLDICTAVLIAPRLVLTARHCVADTDADVACSATGDPVRGGVVHAKHDAQKLFVFTGPNRPVLDPAKWKPAAQGAEVIDDGSANLCNHDIALVLLAKPLAGVPLASLRLDGNAEQDEKLLTVGWGVTEKEEQPAVRQQRSGVTVTRVGADATDPVLTPNEFAFDESICLGDSGGPIFDQQTGGLVGIVSRGGNGRSSDTDLSVSCLMPTNLGTKISPFSDLLNGAFTKAQAQPIVEVRPASPPSDKGCAISARGRTDESLSRALALALALMLTLTLTLRRRSRPHQLTP